MLRQSTGNQPKHLQIDHPTYRAQCRPSGILQVLVTIACLLALSITSNAQDALPSPAIADSIYKSYTNSRFSNPERDLLSLQQLESYLFAQGDTCRQVRVSSWQANCYEKLGQLDSAAAINIRAAGLFNSHCDSLLLMSILAHSSAVYLSRGEFDKAVEAAHKGLAHWNEAWPHDKIKSALYTNKALAQVYSGDLESGSNTFRALQRIAREAGNALGELEAATHLGSLFGFLYKNGRGQQWSDSSASYNKEALAIAKRLEMNDRAVVLYLNLATNETEKGAHYRALAYLDSASTRADAGGFLQHAVSIALARSGIYTKLGKHREAVTYVQRYVVLKDSLLNVEKARAISEVQEKYESERKEKLIKELEVSKLKSELREEQLTKTRNIFIFSAFGVLLIATGLYARLQYMRRSKSAIQKEKEVSDNLLLNILPEEVAEELKAKGEAEARLIEQVTVLFTDFKGFTALSQKVSPKALVHDLHECFSAFDLICEKQGIEKIKTIGDAYMAAGGLPTPNDTHASDAVKAALEMAVFVHEGKNRKIAAGLPYFEIRIGIHTGPVVAGIVGVKKFQYDIWGDTVNTASRMESSGEVGKVNISESTYNLLKNLPEFSFESRGAIEAKGKGKMGMYFVKLKPNV